MFNSKWLVISLLISLLIPQLLVAAPKGFVATVLQDVDACVKEVKKVRGVTSVKGLSAIGIITFKSSAKAAEKIAELECISSVEEEQEVFPQGGEDCPNQISLD